MDLTDIFLIFCAVAIMGCQVFLIVALLWVLWTE